MQEGLTFMFNGADARLLVPPLKIFRRGLRWFGGWSTKVPVAMFHC
jgi:hypothetical protein